MKATVLKQLAKVEEGAKFLEMVDLPDPEPGKHDILIEVSVCGVCHTELDEIEGRTPPLRLPMVLGHQVVGRVAGQGDDAKRFKVGDRVGVAWIYSACGKCHYCLSEQENLCPYFQATGRDAYGGYAELMKVPEEFAYPIPDALGDAQTAPLLCAGAVGYRSLRLTGLEDGRILGLTGFGASGHIVLMTAKYQYPHSPVYVFARDPDEREFARDLGAAWTGETEAEAPARADAIIDTTPVWKPVVEALKNLAPGGRLVINAIRKLDLDQDYLQRIDYPTHLWMEKEIKSVANVTRGDVSEFLQLAAEIPIEPTVQEYALEDASQALIELNKGKVKGAKVLRIRASE